MKKLFTIEQASGIIDEYIQASAKRLSKRLKEIWSKQQFINTKIKTSKHESVFHR
jgi:hypothetical protein